MRISVAMATYNGERWLDAQLASLLDQTRRPDQVVVSDDRSHDSSPAIVKEFARTAPFEVVLLENETNLGYARNFERALGACDGDIVFLSDQDDVWLPEKISTVIEVMERTGSRLVVHDQLLVDDALEIHPPTMIDRLALLGESDRQHVKGCATAVERSLVRVALPVVGPHDNWLHDIAAALGERQVLREPLSLFRVHGRNTSRHVLNRLEAPTPASRRRRRLEKWLFELARSEESFRTDIERREAVLDRAHRLRPGSDADDGRAELRRLRERLERRNQSSLRRSSAAAARRLGSLAK